jgi:hypothetical protein
MFVGTAFPRPPRLGSRKNAWGLAGGSTFLQDR